MLLNAAAPTPLYLVNRVLGASSRAVRDAWSQVGPRAVEGASTGRVFAGFLHLFSTLPFVVGSVDLSLLTWRAVGERLAFPLTLVALVVLAVVAIVSVTLFVAGALIGAAGVLTHIQSHRVAGEAAMTAGVAVGLLFVATGDFVPGWTTLTLSAAALVAQAATWLVDRHAA